jgi:hypothetical protein
MSFRRIAAVALTVLVLSAPFAALAQNAPYSQLVITTQLAPGVSAPAVAPIVTVTATSPSLTVPSFYDGTQNPNSSEVDYASSFNNDTRTVFFTPGSYSVSAGNTTNYYYSYSPDCTGFTPLNGQARSCVVTLSTTPPQTTQSCTSPFYGTAGCVAPVVPYQGPYGQSQLSCSPSYQTVAANQPATFTAQGGTPGGYDWTTTDRTTLNAGTSYTTIFQTTGTQTVIVSNGVQSATCTITVVAGNGAINYTGSSTGGTTTYATTSYGSPSITTSYIPAYLPNTGFGPQNGAALAIAFTLLLSAGIFFYPYVRKALTVVIG